MTADPLPPGRATRGHHLVVVAHGATDDLRAARFGGTASLSHPDLVEPVGAPVERWSCGPEPACRQTVERWGVPAEPAAALAGPDHGRWTGRTLVEVGADEPEALAAWMQDPAQPPPGGESLTALVARVHAFTAALESDGWTGVVTAPVVARALVVAALDAPAALVAQIEVAPGGRAHLTRPHGRTPWRLRGLV